MPMNNRLLVPRNTFTPRSIAGLGAWFDATDTSTLSQTSDGLTPVTANNDPVAYLRCKVSGTALTQTTDANRPLYITSGINTKPGLDFDGTNDVLFAGSGTLMALAKNVSGVTLFHVHKIKSTSAASKYFFFCSTGSSATSGRFGTTNDTIVGTRPVLIARRADADSVSVLNGTLGNVNTNPAIYVATWNYAGPTGALRVNGAVDFAATTFTGLAAGSTSNTDSLQIAIGGVNGASVFQPVVVGEVLAYQRVLTAAEISRVERYLAAKWGVSIP
jgi:hypothetical protein